jgi:cation diffusion facilitator CzcD-associated flavoprotein CzcO
VCVLDYRLAPEYPHPAALQDALAAFDALSAQGPVAIAGDSTGGGLALATALALRDRGGAQPAALWLMSPWVDLAEPLAERAPPGEAMLSRAWTSACAAHFLAGHSALDPAVSPLRGDLRGLPPVLLQAGRDELLCPQAEALHAALTAAEVPGEAEIHEGRWHVFQLHAGQLGSATQAVLRAAVFLHQHWPAEAPAVQMHNVVILGAGMSGLCMGIKLQKAGLSDFVILEKSPGLGGTWWDTRYPGAQVDVPAPVYSFSFAPNPRWRQRFADADEIQVYMQGLAERHALPARMRLGRAIRQAHFDAEAGRWLLELDNGERLSARFFVCSTGPLSQPRWPEIEGLNDFSGRLLHTARWPADARPEVELRGKRIGVIGTGSTAAQLVPPLAANAAQLSQFQRTANWVLPRLERRYFALDQWLARVPPYAAAVRWFWMRVLEWGRRGFDEGTVARRGMQFAASELRRRQLPDERLREALTPPYPLGCKRIIYSNTYYPALSQPNAALVTTPIQRITARGLLTSDGREHEFDALVCATGFETVHLLASLEVRGSTGETLAEAWRDGPWAYHGITMPGFPNLFLMLGPNTATGHTSTLLFIEPSADHAIHCMKRVMNEGRKWIAVRDEVARARDASLQQRLAGSVWSQCRSWYRMDGGRIVAIWPGFTGEYVRAVKVPLREAYELG